MAVVYPESSRVRIDHGDGKVTVTIPVKRNWFIFLFLSFWLCGWAAGEIVVLGSLVVRGAGMFARGSEPSAFAAGSSLFLLVWILGWTVGGIFALAIWLYQLNGREIIEKDGQFLRHVRDFRIYRRNNEYLLEHVKNLRLGAPNGNLFDLMSPGRALEFWGMGGGLIGFDYGSDTIRMGAGLQEAEAQPLIDILGKRT